METDEMVINLVYSLNPVLLKKAGTFILPNKFVFSEIL